MAPTETPLNRITAASARASSQNLTRVTPVAICLLYGGIYLPTSLQGVRHSAFNVLSFGIVLVLLAILAGRARRPNPLKAALATLAFILLLIFTFTGGNFVHSSFGVATVFVTLCLLLTLELSKLKVGPAARTAFALVNVINLTIGVALALHVAIVGDFIRGFYAAGYDTLVPSMLARGKPVLTFGSHSVAGFFVLLFFYLTLRTYRATRQRIHLIFAISYLALEVPMTSSTGFVFFFVGCAVLVLLLWGEWLKTAASLLALALVVVGHRLMRPATPKPITTAAANAANDSSTNGFNARYTSQGVEAQDFHHILEHPLAAIGFGPGHGLWLTDSGYVVMWLRGSILVFVLMYGLFFMFTRQLISKTDSYFLLTVFLMFEVAYPSFLYLRTLAFLPFIVLYLNGLELSSSQDAELRRKWASLIGKFEVGRREAAA